MRFALPIALAAALPCAAEPPGIEAQLRGAWVRAATATEPEIDLLFGADGKSALAVSVLRTGPRGQQVSGYGGEALVVGPDQLVLLNGDRSAAVGFRLAGDALALGGELPADPGRGNGTDLPVRLTGVYRRRPAGNGRGEPGQRVGYSKSLPTR